MSQVGLSIDAIAEPFTGGGWSILSPHVGVYRGAPRPGSRRSAGDTVGRLTMLNTTENLVLPEGVEGVVCDIRIHDRTEAVEYGQALFRLAPLSEITLQGVMRPAPVTPELEATAESSVPRGCHAVISPLDGVFYRSPSPGAAPFVSVGARLDAGRTLGLIEAMKSFSAVIYGAPGLPPSAEVVETRAADAAEVRQGQILFIVRSVG